MDLSIATCLDDSKQKIKIDNHFKVIAGPGAGKTTFVVSHIKNIIEKSDKISDLRKIACITYTNVGVESITAKLGDAYESTEVSTIHSFLYKNVVKPYLWILSDDYEFDLKNINGHDDVKPTYSILSEWKAETKQFALNDDKELSKALSKLSWILKDEIIELGFQKTWYAKAGVYNIKKDSYLAYKKICWKNGLISHDDILFLSYKILEKNSRILDILRGKFPYVLVDEFQDTNPIQSAIIKLIANEETIVGVIGDECQSIYSFQGADVEQFINFNLPNMKLYYISDNRRSTVEIINLLNYVRGEKSFNQKSSDELHGDKPCIILGNFFKSFENVKELCNDEVICSLSYKKELSNQLKYGVESFFSEDATDELLFDDEERGRMIFYSICSMEYCKQLNYKEALKNMRKAYRKTIGFNDRDSFENMKRLSDSYNEITCLNISDFYNSYIYGFYNTKKRISSGNKKRYYDSLTYKQLACVVNINEDAGKFRTIHKAKGDEFENVLLLMNPCDFNESKDLDFLLHPDMTNEEHRVYYVALSRAKKRLFISIPFVSVEVKSRLENIEWIKIDMI
ncbi:UvrD-helicase domain-containing protein [Acetobacterium carbinolicum]|uniref:UvrD-helicase domain-containing protein n=1 Tax=Acetobacterium carbinolicum TaxID=52690 RepID=UPI0039BEED99